MKVEHSVTSIFCDACKRQLTGKNIHFTPTHVVIGDVDLCTECSSTILRELYSVQRINTEDIKMIIERGHYEFTARQNGAVLC